MCERLEEEGEENNGRSKKEVCAEDLSFRIRMEEKKEGVLVERIEEKATERKRERERVKAEFMIQFAHRSFFIYTVVLCLHLHCKCFSFVSRLKNVSEDPQRIPFSHRLIMGITIHHTTFYEFHSTSLFPLAQQSLSSIHSSSPFNNFQSRNCKCTQPTLKCLHLSSLTLLASFHQYIQQGHAYLLPRWAFYAPLSSSHIFVL